MAELLFIATTIFVAYVVFDVLARPKTKPQSGQPEVKQVADPTPTQATSESPQQSKPTPKVAEKTKPISKPISKPVAKKTSPSNTGDSLKNPKTGEVAKIPANYAFAKRWIKEALVAEGLLEKIYKNNELDGATVAKIQEALVQLRAMEKYQ